MSTKVFKDKYFDNLKVKDAQVYDSLKLGSELIQLGGAGGNPFKFTFNNDNVPTPGAMSAQFSFDSYEEMTFDASLGNINYLNLNVIQDNNGEDISLILDELYNQDYGFEYNKVELVNVNNPKINANYILPYYDYDYSYYYIDEPFNYRGFKYVYTRNCRTGYLAPSITKMCIIQTPYADFWNNISVNTDSYDDYFYVENLGSCPTFAYLALYNRSQKPLTIAEMDGFFKRFVDLVVYNGGETIAPIETMKSNFYSKYNAVRGGLDLFKNFEMVNEYYDGVNVELDNPGTGFQVYFEWYNNNYNVGIDNPGSGYTASAVGQKVTIPGTELNGSSPENDVVIEVTSVSGGEITGVKVVSGRANCLSYNYIENGGGNQYDYGNYLENADGSINYGNGEIGDNVFGTGSKYCCVYNDSIFGMFVTDNSYDYFDTYGDIGSHYYGIQNYNNRYYTGFYMGLIPLASNGKFTENDLISMKLSYVYINSYPYMAPAVEKKKRNPVNRAQIVADRANKTREERREIARKRALEMTEKNRVKSAEEKEKRENRYKQRKEKREAALKSRTESKKHQNRAHARRVATEPAVAAPAVVPRKAPRKEVPNKKIFAGLSIKKPHEAK